MVGVDPPCRRRAARLLSAAAENGWELVDDTGLRRREGRFRRSRRVTMMRAGDYVYLELTSSGLLGPQTFCRGDEVWLVRRVGDVLLLLETGTVSPGAWQYGPELDELVAAIRAHALTETPAGNGGGPR